MALHEVTDLLIAWQGGNPQALEQLIPVVHDELRRLARRYMASERRGHPLQPTALVNEAYLRLIDSSRVRWQNRTHFFAMAARLMRRILVDIAREQQRQKRGGDVMHVPLDEALATPGASNEALMALDDALQALARFDPRKCQVVELRFFGGLTVEETAAALGVAPITVMRDWDLARSWLRRELDAPHDA